MKALLIAALLALSTSASAMTIEEYAKKAADSLAPSLPQQVSANMYMMKVMALGDTVMLVAQFTYNKDYLHAALKKTGMSHDYVANGMGETQRKAACSDDALLKFMKAGGELEFRYQYQDGSKYRNYHFTKSDCN